MVNEKLKNKMRVEKPFLLASIALLALAMLVAPLPAFSQSCALCYTQAASAGARMIQALRSGILILIVPPTCMSVGMIFIVYRKRNQFREGADAPASDRDW
ncbi:MAG: hypothetical protein WBQ43_08275 [Terriglobales bacterium]